MSTSSNTDTDSAARQASKIIQAARAMGEADAALALRYLGVAGGGDANSVGCVELMALATRLRRIQLEQAGFYYYAEPVSSHVDSLAAAERQQPGMVPAEALALAETTDLLATRLRHFTPYADLNEAGRAVLMARLREGEPGDDLAPAIRTPGTYSPEAQVWAKALARGVCFSPPVEAGGVDTPVEAADEATCPLDELRQRAWVSKIGAGRLLSISPKAIDNRRRDGRIPRELYDQNGEYGHVRYRTKLLLDYAEQGTRGLPRPNSKKRAKNRP